jgi:ferredoxin
MIVGRILENVVSDAASVLRLDASRCLKMRYGESGCSRCATACPVGAIDLADEVAIKRDICTGCLTCSTACPAGAIEAYVDFNSFLNALAGHTPPVFVIGCHSSASHSHKQLPCLGMLSAEHLIALYSKGNAVVQLAADPCKDCVAGVMLERLTVRLLETARSVRIPIERRVRLVTREEDILYREPGVDRRSFFSTLRNLALQGAREALASPARAKRGLSYVDKALPQRRAILLEAISSLPSAEARSVRDAFSFSASFSDSCDGCLGCARVCPTAAISETEDISPSFNPSRCTGCGLCTEFCVSGAVDIMASAPTSAGHLR